MLIHRIYSKDKSRVYRLNVENNKTVIAKNGCTRTSRPRKRENKLYKLTVTVRQTDLDLENSNIIPQNRDTAQNHAHTHTNVSRRYNFSSSGTKSKHRVESSGSLKTGNNGKCSPLRNQKIHSFTGKRISLLSRVMLLFSSSTKFASL